MGGAVGNVAGDDRGWGGEAIADDGSPAMEWDCAVERGVRLADVLGDEFAVEGVAQTAIHAVSLAMAAVPEPMLFAVCGVGNSAMVAEGGGLRRDVGRGANRWMAVPATLVGSRRRPA